MQRTVSKKKRLVGRKYRKTRKTAILRRIARKRMHLYRK